MPADARSSVSIRLAERLAASATWRSSASRRVYSVISWSAVTWSVMSWSVPFIRIGVPSGPRSTRPRPRHHRSSPSPRMTRAVHSNSSGPSYVVATAARTTSRSSGWMNSRNAS